METIVVESQEATVSAETKPKKKLTSFRELGAWQEAHALAKSVFSTTSAWSGEHAFSLGNPMRRAALSVTSRLAEGFGKFVARDKVRDYSDARASLAELHNQLILSTDVGALDEGTYDRVMPQLTKVDRILGGLIAKTKTFGEAKAAA